MSETVSRQAKRCTLPILALAIGCGSAITLGVDPAEPTPIESLPAPPLSENEYKKVAKQLVNMRKSDVIPYRFIADNTRWMRKPTTYDSLDEMLESAAASYRRSLWRSQQNYVEIWMEKDALAGVFHEVTANARLAVAAQLLQRF